MKDLGILDLLGLTGVPLAGRVKLVRHRDTRVDVHDLFRRGWLESYQAYQSRPIFHKVDTVISFVGLDGGRARLVGVYRVGAHRPASDGVIPPGCTDPVWSQGRFFYELTRIRGFEALENRVIIDWGRAAISWHQKATNKPVAEVLPVGRLLEPFKDYLDFTLTFAELQYLEKHRRVNAEWVSRLRAVAGIYLILDSVTGHQYVGSASGEQGVWGRWASYAKTGHGGNKLLKELVKRPGYPDALTFSLLQVLPRTMPKTELFALEKRFKAKLGSRATGLNAN